MAPLASVKRRRVWMPASPSPVTSENSAPVRYSLPTLTKRRLSARMAVEMDFSSEGSALQTRRAYRTPSVQWDLSLPVDDSRVESGKQISLARSCDAPDNRQAIRVEHTISTAIPVVGALVNDIGFPRREFELMKRATVSKTHLGGRMPVDRKKISLRCFTLIGSELEHADLVIA